MAEDRVRIDLLRPIWKELEKIHIVTYFVRECREAYKELGVEDVWSRYFAGRAAPMGRVTPETVAATFYNFSLSMVRQHMDSVWEVAGPESFITARFEGADRALTRLLGSHTSSGTFDSLTGLLEEVAGTGSPEGKPLYSANLGISAPEKPHIVLFHLATLIREHKGDIHNAVLLSSSVSGVEAHILLSGVGHMSKEMVLASRGWTEEQWTEAEANLRRRGFIDGSGSITAAGKDFRITVEAETESLAKGLWSAVDNDRLTEIGATLSAIGETLNGSKELPAFKPTYEELGML
ncbi:hypothetical protein SAMN02745225_01313 [Ferrithrix thermotolerans DSM 19514]|jgi:hypothetical protein|uniref:Uncharacterized protein n=1 Tax=Ferrithrix thermotolerans DSM 19514 TaxID=1121881 RepID=A0A1M4VGC4_9ACTN|nr:hypothetical protein [Ferrithrix thermotolerans]SHE67977.1 hypothetical protein SAMN02745225_01313 [Ferrithrix thermotolerans DSM 19514]